MFEWLFPGWSSPETVAATVGARLLLNAALVGSVAVGAFLALHGLVHLWYVVLSQGWVEVEEQMGWNGQSWLLSSLLPTGTVLSLASVVYVAVAAGFVAGGVGYALDREWAVAVLVGSAALSTLALIALWDGRAELLVEKGAVGVVINVALAYVLLR